MAVLAEPRLRNLNSPVFDPTVDEGATGEFSHRWCVEFCEYCENDNFIQFDMEVTEVLHRTLDTDLVWFFFRVVWQASKQYSDRLWV